MFFSNQYFPLIAVTVINLVIVYMLYRDLNAVKASISQLSVPQGFMSPTFQLIPPEDENGIIPSSPIEQQDLQEKKEPEKNKKAPAERTTEP